MVTFSGPQSMQNVQVMVTNDQVLEGVEEFLGVLTLPASGSGGVSLGDDTATATIEDDDGMAGMDYFLAGRAKIVHSTHVLCSSSYIFFGPGRKPGWSPHFPAPTY